MAVRAADLENRMFSTSGTQAAHPRRRVPEQAVRPVEVVAGEPVELTPTEFSILVTLIREPGRVLSARQIVTAVWGAEYMEETGYIRRYVWHLRQKLEVDPQEPAYIQTVRGVGYCITGD